jgi:hypothetical protein
MENNKALSADQLNNLKETVRKRFDELYERIGKNRQHLLNKVLFVDQQINKELTKEKINEAHEKEILRKVRETERSAESQLPHIHKVAVTAAPKPSATPKPVEKTEKPAKASKPKETSAKGIKSKLAKKK